MSKYDKIAEQYLRDAEARDDRRYILAPTLRHYMKDVTGKKILDAACGFGYFTRLIKRMGASSVVGVDISQKMIQLAKEYELKDSVRGVEYRLGNISSLETIGQFDFIFAGFLLHYSSSIEELQSMSDRLFANLNRVGEFISFNENPFNPLTYGIKYGHKVELIGVETLCDGSINRRTHYLHGKKTVTYDTFHYTPETYEKVLTKSGFSSVEWLPFVKSPDAEVDFASGYWNEYLSNHCISVLRCTKKRI